MSVATANEQMVSVRHASDGPRIIVMRPKLVMTTDEALSFAAWLVALTAREDEFPAILEQVQNT